MNAIENFVACFSIALAIVSLVLSLVFFFSSNRLYGRMNELLKKLEVTSDYVVGELKDMIRPTWDRFVVPWRETVPDLMNKVRAQVAGLPERGDGEIEDMRNEVLTLVEKELSALPYYVHVNDEGKPVLLRVPGGPPRSRSSPPARAR